MRWLLNLLWPQRKARKPDTNWNSFMDETREIGLEEFLEAMCYEWRCIRYEVTDDGKLRVFYLSMKHLIEWIHVLSCDLVNVPKVGQIGMLGFIPQELYLK